MAAAKSDKLVGSGTDVVVTPAHATSLDSTMPASAAKIHMDCRFMVDLRKSAAQQLLRQPLVFKEMEQMNFHFRRRNFAQADTPMAAAKSDRLVGSGTGVGAAHAAPLDSTMPATAAKIHRDCRFM